MKMVLEPDSQQRQYQKSLQVDTYSLEIAGLKEKECMEELRVVQNQDHHRPVCQCQLIHNWGHTVDKILKIQTNGDHDGGNAM